MDYDFVFITHNVELEAEVAKLQKKLKTLQFVLFVSKFILFRTNKESTSEAHNDNKKEEQEEEEDGHVNFAS